MKRVYRFIAGNSLVTPVGAAAALLVAWFFHGQSWTPFAFVGVLVAALAASVFERVN